MDLVQFFNEHYEFGENAYFDEFYSSVYLVYKGDLDFKVKDTEDLILNWKNQLYPSKFEDSDGEVFFGLLSFWLHKNGHIIDEHPKTFSKWKGRSALSNNEFKNATQVMYGLNGVGNGVAWKDRRLYIDGLIIKNKNYSPINLVPDLELIMSEVSSRNALFESMEPNEKLANIRNAFEYIGKIDGAYIDIPFESLTNNFISKQHVLNYQKELQCFRHGEMSMIEQRDSFTENQKLFYIDFGLIILKLAYLYIKQLKS